MDPYNYVSSHSLHTKLKLPSSVYIGSQMSIAMNCNQIQKGKKSHFLSFVKNAGSLMENCA